MNSITKKFAFVLVFVSLLCCFSTSTAMANTTLPSRCTIASALEGNLVLDVAYNSSENGTNIQVYSHHGGAAQIFDIVHVENEWYRIVHANSGKFLDVAGAVVDKGVNVQIYENTGSDAQLWKFIPTEGGYYIQNKLGYYLDVYNGTAQNGTNVWVWTKNGSNAQVWSLKTVSGQLQPAMWFMDVVKFTQEPGGGYSHKGTLNFDVVGVNNSDIKAPFDCKVVAIHKKWAEGNTVVIESLTPVQYADGTVDYMCMSFAHDNDISDLWVGKTIAQGEVFYQTGNYGNVTGVHAHVSCIRGTYQKDIWKRQPPNNNCGSPNAICPTKALFLPEGIAIYETKGLTFQTYQPLPPVATPSVSTPTNPNGTQINAVPLSNIKTEKIKEKIDIYVQALGLSNQFTYYWNAGFRSSEAQKELRKALDEFAITGNVDLLQVGLTTKYCPKNNKYGEHLFEKGGCTSNIFDGGAQCHGFALYIEYYLHNAYVSDGNYNKFKKSNKTWEEIGGLKAGDLIRCNGHSMVFYDTMEDGTIRVLQCNGYSSTKPCSINFGKVYYTNSKYYTVNILQNLYNQGKVTITRCKDISNAHLVDPIIYNADYYRAMNPDLEQAFGNDNNALLNHWVNHGVYEGRIASPVFWSKYYVEFYDDLNTAFGTNYEAAILHFLNNGINEHRQGHSEFHLDTYKANYKDLQEAFGDNNYQYLLHYVNNGIKEGRTANSFDYSLKVEIPEIPNVPTEDTNTPASTITLQATGAGNITTTNATVYGNASYSGSRPSEVGLLFGENANSLQGVANEAINFSKNPFDIWYDLNKEANITLAPGRIYYYQLYAIVDGQYVYSNVQSFSTPSPVSTWTTGASNITATNATVNGKVQYTGNRPTKVGLLFGISPTDLKDVASENINFSKNPFDIWYDLNKEAHWTLWANQTYYYQFYVVQDGYYYYSNIDSFQN